MQFCVEAPHTKLIKLEADILIGTVPLRETVHSLTDPQLQPVITDQPLSAPNIGTVPLRESFDGLPTPQYHTVILHQPPPIQQPDTDNFDLRTSSLYPGADPEHCFGRGTLDLSRRRWWSETPKALRGKVPPPQSNIVGGLMEHRKLPQRGLEQSPSRKLLLGIT